VGWDRVRGHDALVEGFRRAVRRGRLAHAYLFTGPAGVGKHLFAVELASALLCEKHAPEELQACGLCPSCVQVEAETHPDYFSVSRPEEAHEFPIELMRELCMRFSLKSARGRGKVVILDDADDLNEESANCFLKTLEEPPPRSVLILIGSSPDRQLPTIVSRCQVVRFAPLGPGLVDELLHRQGVEDVSLRERLVRLSGGSPGQARVLADPALWEFRSVFLASLTEKTLNPIEMARSWMAFVEKAGKESAAQRRRAQVVLRLFLDVLSDALAVKLEAKPRRTGPEDQRTLEALNARLSTEKLLALLERCLEADQQIDWRAQLVLVVEAVVDSMVQKLAS
jgi:DNA polymerase-3 subunit delta'